MAKTGASGGCHQIVDYFTTKETPQYRMVFPEGVGPMVQDRRYDHRWCLHGVFETNGTDRVQLARYDYWNQWFWYGAGDGDVIRLLPQCRITVPVDEKRTATRTSWYRWTSGFGKETPNPHLEDLYRPRFFESPEPDVVKGFQLIARGGVRLAAFSKVAQPTESTLQLPAVPISENGSNVPASVTCFYDLFDNCTATINERFILTRIQYNVPRGAVYQIVEDADTKVVPGESITTDMESDEFGRTTSILGPVHEAVADELRQELKNVRSVSWFVYDDVAGIVSTARGYNAGKTVCSVGPMQIQKVDRAGRPTDTIVATRDPLGAAPKPSDVVPQSRWCRWQRNTYDDAGRHLSSCTYHAIPNGGLGSERENYDFMRFEYDKMFRTTGTVSPGGTIVRTTLEARGLPTALHVGLVGQGPPNETVWPMADGKEVSSTIYDHGASGNGNATRVEHHVEQAKSRVINLQYDWRDRVREMKHDEVLRVYEYNELSKVTRLRETQVDATSFVEQQVDVLGRVFRRTRYRRSWTNAKSADSLTLKENVWYDAVGNVIMHQPMGGTAVTKIEYDHLDREVRRYVGVPPEPNVTYWNATSASSDTIWEEIQTTYDAAGNAIGSVHRLRDWDLAFPGTIRNSRELIDIAQELRGRPLTDPGPLAAHNSRGVYTRMVYDAAGRQRTLVESRASIPQNM